MNLTTHEYADAAALETALPYQAGYPDTGAIHDFIKKAESKLMPSYVMEKFTAISSGLARHETDTVAVRADRCHGELGAPAEYVCAPADNCHTEDIDIEKVVIEKDKSLTKNISFDPVCDDDTAMEITRAGGVTKYSALKMQEVAYAFAKAENKAIFDFVAAQTGVNTGDLNIAHWDDDNVVSEFNCLLADLADKYKLDVNDLMAFGNQSAMVAIRNSGALYDNSGQHESFRDNYGINSSAYQFDFQGVPFYADNNFPAGKLFIGVRGSVVYWDSPMYYSTRETGCNHGINHIWTKKYEVYAPCSKKNKFAVVDLAGMACA